MLVRYPAAAFAENWLHDGLIAILNRALDGVIDPMEHWTASFPDEHRDAVGRKTSLKAGLQRVVETIATMDQAGRDALRTCIIEQNRLPEAFSAAVRPPAVGGDPADLANHLDDLFNCAFKMLTPLGVRDRHYRLVYDGVRGRVCGFCGIERLSAPVEGTPREDLDHYLALSLYPLAGANLRNLAPIGGRCNSSYKRDQDILRDANGVPRRCLDPYGTQQVEVSLLGSQPLRGGRKGTAILPKWEITLEGADADRIATWNEVFEIEHRYRNDVLDADFVDWIDHFATWGAAQCTPANADDLVRLIRCYIATVVQEGIADAAFLKRATFKMLAYRIEHCDDADRVAAWLLSLWSVEAGVVA